MSSPAVLQLPYLSDQLPRVPPARKPHMQDPDFVPAPPQEATDKPPQPAHWSQTESPPTDTDSTAPKRPARPEPAAAPAPRAPPASQTAVPTSLIPGMNALVQAAVCQPAHHPIARHPRRFLRFRASDPYPA